MFSYEPEEVPQTTDIADLQAYIAREFRRISQVLSSNSLQFTPLAVAPVKPRAGLIVVADGVNWDPGSGYGAYEYTGTVWRRLA